MTYIAVVRNDSECNTDMLWGACTYTINTQVFAVYYLRIHYVPYKVYTMLVRTSKRYIVWHVVPMVCVFRSMQQEIQGAVYSHPLGFGVLAGLPLLDLLPDTHSGQCWQ